MEKVEFSLLQKWQFDACFMTDSYEGKDPLVKPLSLFD